MYYYSTVVNNSGAYPLARFVYSPLSVTRTNNVARVTFNQTGTNFFTQGSIVVVSGLASNVGVAYTGVALAGGNGYVDFLSPGLNGTTSLSVGGITAPIHPNWSTGMMWIPTWSTEADANMQVVNTQLGEGYSQRMNPVINSNSLSWNLIFAERTDKETMALMNFFQVAGGASYFVVDFPVGNLFNKPGLKYITTPSQSIKQSLTSFGLNTTTVPITQVFDIG